MECSRRMTSNLLDNCCPREVSFKNPLLHDIQMRFSPQTFLCSLVLVGQQVSKKHSEGSYQPYYGANIFCGIDHETSNFEKKQFQCLDLSGWTARDDKLVHSLMGVELWTGQTWWIDGGCNMARKNHWIPLLVLSLIIF